MRKNNKKKVIIKDYYASQDKNNKKKINKAKIGVGISLIIIIALISRLCCN